MAERKATTPGNGQKPVVMTKTADENSTTVKPKVGGNGQGGLSGTDTGSRKGLHSEIRRVVAAVKAGDLDVRACTDCLRSADNELLNEINEMLDHVKGDVEQREDSTENFSAILDNMQDGYFRADGAGALVIVNPCAVQLAGCSSMDELLGRNMSELMSSEDASTLMMELLQHGEVKGVELEVQRVDGGSVSVEFNARMLYGDKGDPVGFEGIARDIMKRKETEEALQEIEQRYRALYDNPLHMLFINDLEGHFLDANEGSLNTVGYDADDVTSLTFQEIVYPDDLSVAYDVLMQVIATGSMPLTEIRVVTKSGGIAWLSVIMVPLKRDGEIYALMGFAENITERRELMRELRETSEFLNGTIDTITDMVIVLDGNCLVTLVNPATEMISGYTAEELLGKSPLDMPMFPAEKQDELAQVFGLLESSGTASVETELVNKDGRVVPIIMSVAVRKEDVNTISGIVVVCKDISDMKELMNEREESARFFEGTINSISDLVVTIDKNLQITMVNPAIERLLGYKAEEVLGQSLFQAGLLPEEVLARVAEEGTMNQFMTEGLRDREIELPHRDGGRSPFSLSGTVTKDTDGSFLGMTIIGKDISEMKKLMKEQEDLTNYFKGTIDSVTDVLLTTNSNMQVSMVNPAFESILGYMPEDVLGKFIGDLPIISSEMAGKVGDLLGDVMTTGSMTLEMELVHKDGRMVPFIIAVGMMKDAEGNVLGMAIVAKDISEIKKLMKEQEELTNYFKGTIDSVTDVILTTNMDMQVSIVNPAMERLLGYSAEEVLGKPVFEIPVLTPEMLAKMSDLLGEIASAGQMTLEEDLVHKDGRRIPFILSVAMMKDAEGNSLGMAIVAKDISDMKKLMDDQEKAASFFKGTIDSIADVIMTTDENLVVNMVNPSMERITGYPPEEVLGKFITGLDTLPPELIANMANLLEDIAREGEMTMEVGFLHKNGRVLPTLIAITMIKGAEGNSLGMAIAAKDITDIRKAMDDAREKVGFLNKIPTPVMAMDKDFNVRYMNPAGASAMGKTQEECVGEKCFNLLNCLQCKTPDCQGGKAMREDGIFTNDTVANLPSGELPIRYTGAPLKDEAGNIIGALEYVLDISEENRAVGQVQNLIEAAVNGQLDTRGDPEAFDIGGWKMIIQGINATMDAVVGPVKEVGGVLNRVADGDLTAKVEADYRGEFERLKDSTNTMVGNLTRLVGAVKEKADSLGISSKQLSIAAEESGQATQHITNSSQQMARGAQEQAQNLQQVTTAMGGVSRTGVMVAGSSQEQRNMVEYASGMMGRVSSVIGQVAVNAQSAAESGAKSTEATHHSAEMTEKTARAMGEIKDSMGMVSGKVEEMSESATQISKIVGTITEVAAQTNLLALNAAIEAARAGEQGRGFSVVADEVRKLAERTAVATKETADLISSMQRSVKQAVDAVGAGTKLAGEGAQLSVDTAEALKSVLREVESAQKQVEQISTAADEMNTSSAEMVKSMEAIKTSAENNTEVAERMMTSATEIAQSVENTAGIAEENSAATEEVSASAEEMSGQVEEIIGLSQSLAEMATALQGTVTMFKLGDNDGGGTHQS